MSEAATQRPDERPRDELRQSVEQQCAQHPDLSGIHPLNDGLDAFAARYLLMGMAQHTIDVQYYIWHNDMSGRLLFSALLDAAQRGVRVRLLLDDNNTPGLDDTLAELDRHPNIAVRLFNPFSFRTLRALGYLTDFARLNRRMHNKSLTVDGAVTLVGGRNIGDEYFGTGNEPLFTDLDVLAIGPVVAEVADDFERYWHSKAVSPLRSVVDIDAGSAEESTRVLGQLKATVRRNYSSPPNFGAQVVSCVLNDEALLNNWLAEVETMRLRIIEMRQALVKVLSTKLPGQNFDYLLKQRGMFSYTGLSAQQVDRLRDEFGVYLIASGRMCVAGLNSRNVNQVAEAFAAVM